MSQASSKSSKLHDLVITRLRHTTTANTWAAIKSESAVQETLRVVPSTKVCRSAKASRVILVKHPSKKSSMEVLKGLRLSKGSAEACYLAGQGVEEIVVRSLVSVSEE